MTDKKLVLILGGVRSGKSAFAEELAGNAGERVVFLATAAAGDDEMAERIAAHRARRPATWRTVEAERDLARALAPHLPWAEGVVVDCVTLLVSNILLEGGPQRLSATRLRKAEAAVMGELDHLIDAYVKHGARFVIVSGEVGLGLVPTDALGRAYRDLLGSANQRLASAASEVYLLVAGLPVPIKGPRD